MRLLKRVKNAFNYKSHLKSIEEISKKAEEQREAIDLFMSRYDPTIEKFCSLRNDRCISCGLMFWEKDINHRYTTANEEHCENFYKLSFPDCKKIIGSTDAELMKDWNKNSGIINTFGTLCVSTDEYIKTHMKPTRFFEFGYRGEEALLFDICKSPIIKNGVFAGSYGTAVDVSMRESEMVDLLQYYMSTNQAFRLDHGEKKDIAAYLIMNNNKKFNRDFPEGGNSDYTLKRTTDYR